MTDAQRRHKRQVRRLFAWLWEVRHGQQLRERVRRLAARAGA